MISTINVSGLKVGKSPAGKALRFVHRGSYDSGRALLSGCPALVGPI